MSHEKGILKGTLHLEAVPVEPYFTRLSYPHLHTITHTALYVVLVFRNDNIKITVGRFFS